ncbi:MAG: hypothetical protein K2Q18_00060, partial [Bdellovibrionales bacterium]|nr:hypothetical protein [Bdellovibrionales bacterium]
MKTLSLIAFISFSAHAFDPNYTEVKKEVQEACKNLKSTVQIIDCQKNKYQELRSNNAFAGCRLLTRITGKKECELDYKDFITDELEKLDRQKSQSDFSDCKYSFEKIARKTYQWHCGKM